jgi:nicotinamide/nicotinate riboside kinase
VQDWDAAPGAISWSKLVDFLRRVKDTGEIPQDHRSHDHLNEQQLVEIDDEVRDYWRKTFEDIKREQKIKGGQKIVWGLVDGFLLYWNKVRIENRKLHITKHPGQTQEVIDQLDVCIFLRVPHDVLKKRRHERHGYHTAGMKTRALILYVTLTSFHFHLLLPIKIDVLSAT